MGPCRLTILSRALVSQKAQDVPWGSTTAVGANRCPPVWLVLHTRRPHRAGKDHPRIPGPGAVPRDPQQRSLPPMSANEDLRRTSAGRGFSSRTANVAAALQRLGIDDELGPLERRAGRFLAS